MKKLKTTSSDLPVQRILDKIESWRLIYESAGDKRVAAIIEGVYDSVKKILHESQGYSASKQKKSAAAVTTADFPLMDPLFMCRRLAGYMATPHVNAKQATPKSGYKPSAVGGERSQHEREDRNPYSDDDKSLGHQHKFIHHKFLVVISQDSDDGGSAGLVTNMLHNSRRNLENQQNGSECLSLFLHTRILFISMVAVERSSLLAGCILYIVSRKLP